MKKKVNITFDTDNLKKALIFVIYVSAFGATVYYLALPVLFFILDLLLLLAKQYLTLEGNFRFFGTFVLLIIVWKVFEALVSVLYELFNGCINQLQWKQKKK